MNPLQLDPKLSIFMEAAPDAIVVVNRDGRIVMVNQLTEKVFGYTRNEIHGQQVEILIPERFRGVHTGHRTGYFHEPKTRQMEIGRASCRERVYVLV